MRIGNHRGFFYSLRNNFYQTGNHDEYVISRVCVRVRQKKKPRLIPDARSKRCVEIPCERSVLRSVCSAWIFIRPVAMPSPNNARPLFVRAIPSTRKIQPRPQLWISPRPHLYTPWSHTHPEYYIFFIFAHKYRGLFFTWESYRVIQYSWIRIVYSEIPIELHNFFFLDKSLESTDCFRIFESNEKNKASLRKYCSYKYHDS